jgi:ATP-dependent DNA ligase
MSIMKFIDDNRPKIRAWKETPCRWVQVKEDGYRITLTWENDGQFIARGKKRDFTEFFETHPNLAHIAHLGARNSAVDGELFVKGGHATDVVTACLQGWESLHFHVFAVPLWDSVNMFNTDVGVNINTTAKDLGFDVVETTEYRPHMTKTFLNQVAVFRGLEGFVLKNRTYGDWWKYKPQQTVDAFVTGFKWGNGKFSGMVGSLQVAVLDEHGQPEVIANVSGMDEDDRHLMSDMADRGVLNNLVCEVKYQSVAAKGRLQFPRFIRWRDDKAWTECTKEQLEC